MSAVALVTPTRKGRRPLTPEQRIERARKNTAELIEQARQIDKLPERSRIRSPLVRLLMGNVSESTLGRWIKAGHFPRPENGTWTAKQVRDAMGIGS